MANKSLKSSRATQRTLINIGYVLQISSLPFQIIGYAKLYWSYFEADKKVNLDNISYRYCSGLWMSCEFIYEHMATISNCNFKDFKVIPFVHVAVVWIESFALIFMVTTVVLIVLRNNMSQLDTIIPTGVLSYISGACALYGVMLYERNVIRDKLYYSFYCCIFAGFGSVISGILLFVSVLKNNKVMQSDLKSSTSAPVIAYNDRSHQKEHNKWTCNSIQ